MTDLIETNGSIREVSDIGSAKAYQFVTLCAPRERANPFARRNAATCRISGVDGAPEMPRGACHAAFTACYKWAASLAVSPRAADEERESRRGYSDCQ